MSFISLQKNKSNPWENAHCVHFVFFFHILYIYITPNTFLVFKVLSRSVSSY